MRRAKMASKANNTQFRIGLDANIIIYLAKLDNEYFDPHSVVKDLLEKHALDTNIYKTTPFKYLPPILKDPYLGEIVELPSGVKIYGHLQDIYNLLTMIKTGEVAAYITPTVKYEVEERQYVVDFIDEYIHEIKVDDKETDFWLKRKELAYKYAAAGAVDLERDAVNLKEDITADACIAAEFALCGLNFITANEKHLVHVNVDEQDYKRTNRIQNVNWDYGLRYTSRREKLYAPYTLSVHDFRIKLKKKFKGLMPVIDFADMRVDEDNNYLSR